MTNYILIYAFIRFVSSNVTGYQMVLESNGQQLPPSPPPSRPSSSTRPSSPLRKKAAGRDLRTSNVITTILQRYIMALRNGELIHVDQNCFTAEALFRMFGTKMAHQKRLLNKSNLNDLFYTKQSYTERTCENGLGYLKLLSKATERANNQYRIVLLSLGERMISINDNDPDFICTMIPHNTH